MKRFARATLVGVVMAAAAAVAFGQAQSQPQSQSQGQGRGRGPSPEALATASTRPAVVSKAEYEKWKTELSNWGRWGTDDQLGAINLITPAKRKQAAGLVKDGIPVSLAGDVNTERSVDNGQPYEHVMTQAGPAGAGDSLSVSFHGYAHTHLDAFAHRFFDGKMWNGFTYEEVTKEDGAKKNSIYTLHNGIFTRGVLIDIPRLKHVPYLEPGTRIFIEDLEAWEKQTGVKVAPGDAIFIRTGRWARRSKTGPWNVGAETAGLDPSVLPWLKRRNVSILGSETAQDATPPPMGSELGPLALHDFALIVLGIHLMDDTNLEAISEAAAAHKRWEFLLTASPLPVRNGTGSPLNPIAVF